MTSLTTLPAPITRTISLATRDLQRPLVVPIAVLLLGTDLLLASFHLGHHFTGRFNHVDWNLTRERSAGEYFQYLKYIWCCWMFLLVFSRRRQALDLAWAGLMAYLLLDDYKSFHEKGGGLLTRALGFQPRFGLRGHDFGEATYVLIVGSVVMLALVLAYRASDRFARADFAVLIALMFGLLLAGVGVDSLHILVLSDPVLEPVVGLLEDGGEMIVMSLITIYCIHMITRPQPGPRSGHAGPSPA